MSNFYAAAVTYGGVTYKNNEAAFQAQKSLDPAERLRFAAMDLTAKRTGRRVKLREDSAA